MGIQFKYTPPGKVQSAQQLGEWFSPVKQQLDDYFATITDDLFPAEMIPAQRADYKQAKYAEYLAAIEREKRLAEQSLKFSQRAAQLTPEQLANINKADAELVEAAANQGNRTAKVPQGVTKIEGDIFIPKEEEQALRDQFRNVQNGFFDELKKRGLIQVLTSEGNRVVPKQYATWDKTLGERGRYTLKPEVVQYLKGRKANAPQGVVSQPISEAPPVPHNAGLVEFDKERNEWIPVQSFKERTGREMTTDDIKIAEQTPRQQAEVAWALSGQNQFKSVVIDGKRRGIPWEKEEWIQNYLNSKAAPLPSNTEAEAVLNDLDNLFLNSQPQSTPQEIPGTAASTPTDNGAIAPEALSEVLASQPQYEGKSSVESAPPSGVNLLADGYQSGTSFGIPGSGSMNFGREEFNRQNNYVPFGSTPNHPEIPGLNDPVDADANLKWLWERNQRETQAREQYLNNKAREEANTGSWWGNVWDGTTRGFQYGVDAGRHKGRTASAAWNRAPESQYAHLQDEGRFGFGVGRVAGDVIGNGSRQVLWNLQPADFVGTHGANFLGKDANRMAKVVVPFAAVTGLELGSQIYNPFNLGEGGRVAGYQAINPDDEDPRISTNPVGELLIDRGLLGKRGRLLPWEQFRQERTDIPYEQYEKYQNYLRNKDENFLRDATGGLIKGTLDGINGPELSVMGYSVTPTGALAAGAALLAGRELIRTGRIAEFRK